MADPFLAGLVNYVRSMSDDAILALVRDKVGAWSGAPAAVPAPAPKPAKAPAPAAKPAPAARPAAAPKKVVRQRPARDAGARDKLLDQVEKAVKASRGLSASEVAAAVGIRQSRVAGALRELKSKKRIFQGGDRRFARYAGDAKAAELASSEARRNASGPVRKGPKAGKKG